jgi:hypothetical protein
MHVNVLVELVLELLVKVWVLVAERLPIRAATSGSSPRAT